MRKLLTLAGVTLGLFFSVTPAAPGHAGETARRCGRFGCDWIYCNDNGERCIRTSDYDSYYNRYTNGYGNSARQGYSRLFGTGDYGQDRDQNSNDDAYGQNYQGYSGYDDHRHAYDRRSDNSVYGRDDDYYGNNGPGQSLDRNSDRDDYVENQDEYLGAGSYSAFDGSAQPYNGRDGRYGGYGRYSDAHLLCDNSGARCYQGSRSSWSYREYYRLHGYRWEQSSYEH